MTGDKDDETTRLAIAKEDACPWLGKILGTYIELKYGEDAPGSPKRDPTALDAIDDLEVVSIHTSRYPQQDGVDHTPCRNRWARLSFNGNLRPLINDGHLNKNSNDHQQIWMDNFPNII